MTDIMNDRIAFHLINHQYNVPRDAVAISKLPEYYHSYYTYT